MELEINETSDPVIINLHGSLEVLDQNFRDIKNRLFDLCKDNTKDIVIDLSGVDYIDSTGIGLLTSISKLQRKNGKKLKIKKASLEILNVIQLSSLSEFLGTEV